MNKKIDNHDAILAAIVQGTTVFNQLVAEGHLPQAHEADRARCITTALDQAGFRITRKAVR